MDRDPSPTASDPRPAAAGTDDDAGLLARWRERGDEGALGLLIDRHRPMVAATCRQVMHRAGDAEDAVQETFTALAHQAPQISGQLGAWLRVVATHRALVHLRSQQRRRGREAAVSGPPEIHPVREPPGGDLVEACLAELDDEDRSLLVRLFWQGDTQAEIARQERVPRVTIHRRQARALGRLRQLFARRGVRMGLPALALLLADGDRALAAEALRRPVPATVLLGVVVAGLVATVVVARAPAGPAAPEAPVQEGAAAAPPAAPAAAGEPPAGAAAPAPAPDATRARWTLEADWSLHAQVGGGVPGRLPSAALPLGDIEVGVQDREAGAEGNPSRRMLFQTGPLPDDDWRGVDASPWCAPLTMSWSGGETTRVVGLEPPPGRILLVRLRPDGRRAGLAHEASWVLADLRGGWTAVRGIGIPLADQGSLYETTLGRYTGDGEVLRRTWLRRAHPLVEDHAWVVHSRCLLLGIGWRQVEAAEMAQVLARCPGADGSATVAAVRQ